MKKNISIATLVLLMNQAIFINPSEYFSMNRQICEPSYFPKLFYRKRGEHSAFPQKSLSF